MLTYYYKLRNRYKVPPTLQCSIRCRLMLLICTFMLFSVLPGSGQGTRRDISTLTNPELLAYANVIKGWLKKDLIMHHNIDFSSIHTTPNFLKFHREHILTLDAYLVAHGLDICPIWDPTTPIPWYFNGFEPSPIDPNTGYPTITFNNIDPDCPVCISTHENYYDYGRNSPSVSLPPNLELPQSVNNVYPRTNLCSYGDLTILEGEINSYHNDVHSTVGGMMGNPQTAAATFLFWPWHAYVDNLWFNWDCHCSMKNGEVIAQDANGGLSGNNYAVTNAYDYPLGLTVSNSATGITTWNNPNQKIVIKGILTIPPGQTLIVGSGQVVEFQDTRYSCEQTRVIVQAAGINQTSAGGVLIIEDGAQMRGISSLGVPNGSGETVYYDSRWDGILVQGVQGLPYNAIQHGKVILRKNNTADGGHVMHGVIGIESQGGGIIQSDNSTFLDNRTSIQIDPYFDLSGLWKNASYIRKCIFKTSGDPIPGYTAGVKYDVAGNFYHHLGYGIKNCIALNGVIGVRIVGDSFINNIDTAHLADVDRGTAIIATDASFGVYPDDNPSKKTKEPVGCTTERPDMQGNFFMDFNNGIVVNNILSHRKIKVLENNFTDVAQCIIIAGDDSSVIWKNNFTWADGLQHNPLIIEYGIYSNNSRGFKILENNLNWAPTMVLASTSGYYGISVENSAATATSNPDIRLNVMTNSSPYNTFSTLFVGNAATLTNTSLMIECNRYQNMSYDWATNGTLKNQGAPGFGAANIFSTTPLPGSGFNLLHLAAAPFTYYAKNAAFEVPVTSNVIVTPAGSRVACNGTTACDIYKFWDWSIDKPIIGCCFKTEPSGNDYVGNSFNTININDIAKDENYLSKAKEMQGAEGHDAEVLSSTLQSIYSSGRDYSKMTNQEVNNLVSIACNTTNEGLYANAVLRIYTEKIIAKKYTSLEAFSHAKDQVTNAGKFHIYPNPNSGNFNMEYQIAGNFSSAKVQVIDILGRMVFENALTGNTGTVQVSLPELTPGIFTTVLRVDGQVYDSGKILIEK